MESFGVRCDDIAKFIEEIAPLSLAESWDNSGWQIRDGGKEARKVLLCLDLTLEVAKEAVNKGADMVISHHPLFFKGLNCFDAGTPKGRIALELIKHGICVYSSHTNFDIAEEGLNSELARRLGLENTQSLIKKKEEKLYKLVVFVPPESLDQVREAICREGAGRIGNYSCCTFSTEGTGTFLPLEGTNPYIGRQGKLELVREYRLETVVPEGFISRVVDAMIKAHPYEEAAYDIYPLKIKGKEQGLGKLGYLKEKTRLQDFIGFVKQALGVGTVRLIGPAEKEVSKVAVYCGSFDPDYKCFLSARPDVLITGDVKYHEAVELNQWGLTVLDAGHFHTEKIFVPMLKNVLSSPFEGVEFIESSEEKDPFLHL